MAEDQAADDNADPHAENRGYPHPVRHAVGAIEVVQVICEPAIADESAFEGRAAFGQEERGSQQRAGGGDTGQEDTDRSDGHKQDPNRGERPADQRTVAD